MDAYSRTFGEMRLHPIFSQSLSVPETGEKLVEAVKRHASGCQQNDDITLVCIGRQRIENESEGDR
jgi:serine phosphatase RsbU (regulator of sigma subunit)